MCGRYLRRSDKQRIAEAFEVSKGLADLVLPPWDYNVAPTSFQPVIRADSETRDSQHPNREIALMRWGLVPYFAKDLRNFGYSTINARAESLTSSATFRTAFERHRCLVPADGFYEWKTLPAAPTQTLFGLEPADTSTKSGKKTAAEKQPYVYTMANDAPFAFAGLWDRWKDPAGAVLESYSIITTTPNELTAQVHDRMPVILNPRDYDLWLSRAPVSANPQAELLALLRPYPADLMAAHEVHKDVGNVRNNHPGLLNSA